MAKIIGEPRVEMKITMTLSEAEAGALDALTGYGIDSFLKVFYEHMGKAYLQKYEAGLRSLFDSVQRGEASVRSFLQTAKDCREVAAGYKIAVKPAAPSTEPADVCQEQI